MKKTLRTAVLIAKRDLLIERRTKVVTFQIVPFALLVLVLFGFALDNVVIRTPSISNAAVTNLLTNKLAASGANRSSDAGYAIVASGLFWITVLFTSLMAIARSFAIETADGGLDALRMSHLDAGGIFIGKLFSVVVELLLVEAIMGAGVLLFFRTPVDTQTGWLAIVVALLATVGFASAGVCYGAMSCSLSSKDTLLPLLFFPVASPILLAATKATSAALNGVSADVWPWIRLVVAFCLIYVAIGVVLFDQLLEDS